MSRRRHKIILILVSLAMVISPLRGAFAMPDLMAADNGSHCQQMQDDSLSPARMIDMQLASSGNSDHMCENGCDGDCCDSACNACVHATIAITSLITSGGAIHANPPGTGAVYSVAGQFAHPPFRPPILQS